MQVSVKTVGALGRQLTVAVPAEQFEQAFVNRLQRLSRQTRLPGFRPGKAPLKIVEARYGLVTISKKFCRPLSSCIRRDRLCYRNAR